MVLSYRYSQDTNRLVTVVALHLPVLFSDGDRLHGDPKKMQPER